MSSLAPLHCRSLSLTVYPWKSVVYTVDGQPFVSQGKAKSRIFHHWPTTEVLNVQNVNHLVGDPEEAGSFSCECFDLKVAFSSGYF